MHLAEPVESAVKSEMLKDSEDADEEAKTHAEPDETPPVLERSKGLDREKKKKQIGKKEKEFDARAVGRSGGSEKPLGENDHGEGGEGWQKGREDHLFVALEIKAGSPDQENQAGTGFEDGAGPILDSAMGQDRERDKSANAETEKLHGLERSAEAGTKATSSTQAVP
jgi:hypothetical protein